MSLPVRIIPAADAVAHALVAAARVTGENPLHVYEGAASRKFRFPALKALIAAFPTFGKKPMGRVLGIKASQKRLEEAETMVWWAHVGPAAFEAATEALRALGYPPQMTTPSAVRPITASPAPRPVVVDLTSLKAPVPDVPAPRLEIARLPLGAPRAGAAPGLRIMDEGFGGCRWPISGEAEETRFCCAERPEGEVYCSAHRRVAAGSVAR